MFSRIPALCPIWPVPSRWPAPVSHSCRRRRRKRDVLFEEQMSVSSEWVSEHKRWVRARVSGCEWAANWQNTPFGKSAWPGAPLGTHPYPFKFDSGLADSLFLLIEIWFLTSIIFVQVMTFSSFWIHMVIEKNCYFSKTWNRF